MEENLTFEETVVEDSAVSTADDLSQKLGEASSLSEKACVAIGALALAGLVACGNCAYKGGKKAFNWAKGKYEDHKAKKAEKAEAKKTEEAEKSAEESKEETSKDSK